jgi:hypothetical protein
MRYEFSQRTMGGTFMKTATAIANINQHLAEMAAAGWRLHSTASTRDNHLHLIDFFWERED